MIVAESSSISPRYSMSLSAHDVHVWRLRLEQPELCAGEFVSMLSGEERRRATRFRFEKDRKRFIAGRGVLRLILAFYLNTEPEQLQFSYGAYGKPYVPQGSCEMAVQFSLCHSHEVALYAFALGRNVGVDVEHVRHFPDIEQMSTRYHTEKENAVFKPLPTSQKVRAFFQSWTRKEAYLKGIGTGLAQPPERIDASMAPGESPPTINTQEDAVETSGWSMASFTPDPDYVAALAIEGHDWRFHRILSPMVFGFSRPQNAGWVRRNRDQLLRIGGTRALCGLETIVYGHCPTSPVSA